MRGKALITDSSPIHQRGLNFYQIVLRFLVGSFFKSRLLFDSAMKIAMQQNACKAVQGDKQYYCSQSGYGVVAHKEYREFPMRSQSGPYVYHYNAPDN